VIITNFVEMPVDQQHVFVVNEDLNLLCLESLSRTCRLYTERMREIDCTRSRFTAVITAL